MAAKTKAVAEVRDVELSRMVKTELITIIERQEASIIELRTKVKDLSGELNAAVQQRDINRKERNEKADDLSRLRKQYSSLQAICTQMRENETATIEYNRVMAGTNERKANPAKAPKQRYEPSMADKARIAQVHASMEAAKQKARETGEPQLVER